MDMLPAKTEYKISKITYIIEARSSENAKDTLTEKVNKALIRDMSQNTGNITKNQQKTS